METQLEKFLEALGKIYDGVEKAERETKSDWHPDAPPIFLMFSAVGCQIVRDFDHCDESTRQKIFSMVENAMRSQEADLVSAVSTGLIESLVGCAARADGEQGHPKIGFIRH